MSDESRDLLDACRVLDGEHLTDAFGHVSVREGDGFLVTPKIGPGRVHRPEQLLSLSLDGSLLAGDASLIPAELPLHRRLFAARPDIRAVCRFHGEACMAWSTLGRPLKATIGPALALGASIPIFDSTRAVTTDEQADEVASILADGSAVLMRGFGAVTVGRSVAEAVVRATVLERAALASLQASAIAEPLVYPEEVAHEFAAADVVLVAQIHRAWSYLRERWNQSAAAPASASREPERSQPDSAPADDTIWLALSGGGVQEHFYDAGGIRTRVLEAGDGPSLLLLHGTGGHAETYYRNIVPLSRHFRVLAIDLVGHGFTDRPDVDYSLDDYADHLESLMDALEIERAHVSGESLGAAVTAWFAITRPDRIDRIILNTAVLALPTKEGVAELEEVARRTIALMSSGFTREAVQKRMEWLVADPARMTQELIDCRYRIYAQPGMLETVAKVMISLGGMFRGLSGQQYLEPGTMSRITCPTLVLWSEHNPGQGVEFAREIAQEIPDHTFEVLKDCGHWPQFEQSDAFNQLHIEFLTAHRAASVT